jgi:hypothetical protein
MRESSSCRFASCGCADPHTPRYRTSRSLCSMSHHARGVLSATGAAAASCSALSCADRHLRLQTLHIELGIRVPSALRQMLQLPAARLQGLGIAGLAWDRVSRALSERPTLPLLAAHESCRHPHAETQRGRCIPSAAGGRRYRQQLLASELPPACIASIGSRWVRSVRCMLSCFDDAWSVPAYPLGRRAWRRVHAAYEERLSDESCAALCSAGKWAGSGELGGTGGCELRTASRSLTRFGLACTIRGG